MPKNLVLIGGGHSHAIVMRMFVIKPLPRVHLTLIIESTETPYSGIGHIAGFYTHDECHIDLQSLANFACLTVNNQVLSASRPSISFEVLSIDIASTPSTISVLPECKYVIMVKKMQNYYINGIRLFQRSPVKKYLPRELSVEVQAV